MLVTWLAATREAAGTPGRRGAPGLLRSWQRRRNAGVSSDQIATCHLGGAGFREADPAPARSARPGAAKEHVACPSVQLPEQTSRSLPLPTPTSDVMYHTYRSDLSQVRALVLRQAIDAGLTEGRANDLVLAVSEVAANTLRHTRSSGHAGHVARRGRGRLRDPRRGHDHRPARRPAQAPARRVRRPRALARPPGLRPGRTDLGRERDDHAHAHDAPSARRYR